MKLQEYKDRSRKQQKGK